MGGAVAVDDGKLEAWKLTAGGTAEQGGVLLATNHSSLDVRDSSFSGFSSGTTPASPPFTADNGGCILALDADEVRVWGSRFEHCATNGNGAGMAVIDDLAPSYPTLLDLVDTEFVENSAQGDGGGLYTYGVEESSIEDCVFDSNHSVGDGGGAMLGRFEGRPLRC